MISAQPFIGIDFGTSKSAMSWYNPKTRQAEVINNFEGKPETPSVVYLGKSESEVVAGELAERKLREGTADQRSLAVSVKRNLLAAAIKVLDDNRKYRPADIAAVILRKLREDAEKQHFHEPVTRAVIAHPASFGPLQQDKIKLAARLAGFTEVQLLPEPIAAALAYGYTGLKVGNYILVYDFGGGTFDVAALARVNESSFRWVAEPKGLETCGGDDLDRELYDYCEEIARQTLHIGISLTGDIDLKFLYLCRDRKENLSFFEEETFSSYLPSNKGPVLFEHTLRRGIFEERIRRYIDLTVSLTKDVMREALAKQCIVDTVVLIGGSSRVPMILDTLSSTLSVQPQEWQQRDFAVALGAAYYGIQIWPSPPPRSPDSPTPPPDPSETYQQAVRRAWEPANKLTQAQLNELGALSARLGLNPNSAKSIEYAIMGHSKEDDLAQQHYAALSQYRTAVSRAWLDKTLTPVKMNDLVALANRLSLSKDEVTTIEREIMGDMKEPIWERQRRQLALGEYRAAVQRAWEPHRTITQTQLTELASQATKLGLSREEAATIERQLMSDTKEVIWERQRHHSGLNEYRQAVKRAWEPTTVLTQPQVADLAAQAIKFGLSREEATTIEREIMGDMKEHIYERQRHQDALNEYRSVVRSAWEVNKTFTPAQVKELTTRVSRLGLSKDEAANIERDIIGNTKESFPAGVGGQNSQPRKWRWTAGKVVSLILFIFCSLGLISSLINIAQTGAAVYSVVFIILMILCLIWFFHKPKPKLPAPVHNKPPAPNTSQK